jgi:hypothetical protein
MVPAFCFLFCFLTPVAPPVQRQLSFCDGYKPGITWSARDTRQTKEQIDRKNRVYKALCKSKS